MHAQFSAHADIPGLLLFYGYELAWGVEVERSLTEWI